MKAWFSERLTRLADLLEEVERLKLPAIEESCRAMDILLPFDKEFKEKVRQSEFPTAADEIFYFRHQRPKLTAHLLFHSKRYHIELQKPHGSPRGIDRYYRRKLDKVDAFFEDNAQFIAYMRSGLTDLDSFFFRRNNISYKTVPESSYYALDECQTTNYDLKAGKLVASERLAEYLRECIGRLAGDSEQLERVEAAEPSKAPVDYNGLLKPHQVEKRLNVSASTLKRMRARGEIECIRVRERGYLYEEREIQRFLAARRHRNFDD